MQSMKNDIYEDILLEADTSRRTLWKAVVNVVKSDDGVGDPAEQGSI